MSDIYDEIIALENDIVAGKVNKIDVEKKIKELKGEFGRDIFPGFNFEKKSKPWTKDYLLTLRQKSITGACSEEFIMHMAEVSENVYSKQTEGKDTSFINYKDNIGTVKFTGNDAGYGNIVKTDMF